MASPRSREIMDDLREDPLARYVLGRVEIGPYVRHSMISRSLFGYPSFSRVQTANSDRVPILLWRDCMTRSWAILSLVHPLMIDDLGDNPESQGRWFLLKVCLNYFDAFTSSEEL